jgi:hypothetical protein
MIISCARASNWFIDVQIRAEIELMVAMSDKVKGLNLALRLKLVLLWLASNS